MASWCARLAVGGRLVGWAMGVVVLAALAAGCHGDAAPVRRKTTLVHVPRDYAVGSANASDDMTRVAYPRRGIGGYHLVNDGVIGPLWDTIHIRGFAPGTHRLFYWGTRGDRAALVADGNEVPIGRSRHEYLVFDPSGQHWAVVGASPDPASPDERIVVIADGEVRGRHRDASVPALSPDGMHVAWIAEEPGGDEQTQMRLLVDGAVRHATDVVPGPCISPLGGGGDAAQLPAEARVLYLSDGRIVALMRDGDGWGLFRDGTRIARFTMNRPRSTGTTFAMDNDACRETSAIVSGSLVAADKAPVAAWWERADGHDGRWRVVVDGEPAGDTTCMLPWEAQPPVLTADGRRVAYPCYTRYDDRVQELHVILGDRRYGPYAEVYGVTLSADGRHVAYAATHEPSGYWTMYRDGVPYPQEYFAVWRPRFDPSGEHLAWEGTSHDQGVLVLDGRRVALFDELLDGPSFLDPDHVSWVYGRHFRFVRLTLPLSR